MKRALMVLLLIGCGNVDSKPMDAGRDVDPRKGQGQDYEPDSDAVEYGKAVAGGKQDAYAAEHWPMVSDSGVVVSDSGVRNPESVDARRELPDLRQEVDMRPADVRQTLEDAAYPVDMRKPDAQPACSQQQPVRRLCQTDWCQAVDSPANPLDVVCAPCGGLGQACCTDQTEKCQCGAPCDTATGTCRTMLCLK